MPTPKKKNSAPTKAPVVTNRSAAIKSARLAEATPDSRDPVHPAPPTSTIPMRPAPEAKEAIELRGRAQAIVVKDRDTHLGALEFVRGAKQLQRKITEHWQRITRSVDDLKRNMLNLKRQDLEPIEQAIAIVERQALDYENAERERVRQAEEAQRLERERKAREDRQRELDAAEDKALELEQASENLSPRELWFVTKVVEQGWNAADPSPSDMRAMLLIAEAAGYKKPIDVQVARLLRSQKVLDAIQAKRDAIAIREQADARRHQPIDVVDAPPVQANLGRLSGTSTRTSYSCEVLDASKLKEAFLNGEVSAEALMPNEVYLNTQARSAKSAEIFERAFPGCRLVKRQTIAG